MRSSIVRRSTCSPLPFAAVLPLAPSTWTRLSGAFAHLPDSCTDEPIAQASTPRSLPKPMPSGRALLQLIDEMIEQGLLATNDSPRPVLHLTIAGFTQLTAEQAA